MKKGQGDQKPMELKNDIKELLKKMEKDMVKDWITKWREVLHFPQDYRMGVKIIEGKKINAVSLGERDWIIQIGQGINLQKLEDKLSLQLIEIALQDREIKKNQSRWIQKIIFDIADIIIEKDEQNKHLRSLLLMIKKKYQLFLDIKKNEVGGLPDYN